MAEQMTYKSMRVETGYLDDRTDPKWGHPLLRESWPPMSGGMNFYDESVPLETRRAARDEQMVMLRDLLDDLTDPSEALADIKALYEAYLADNRAQVNRLNQDSMDEDTAEHAFYADYYRLLINDRNKDWAQDITGYLREGGTTFIFAGAAHWVGDNSVFSYHT